MTDEIYGVGILPVIERDVLLVEIYRHPLGKTSLEILKGFIDQDERACAAAARELFEETGYKVDEDKIEKVCISSSEGGVIKGRMMLFQVDLISATISKVNGNPEMGAMCLKRGVKRKKLFNACWKEKLQIPLRKFPCLCTSMCKRD